MWIAHACLWLSLSQVAAGAPAAPLSTEPADTPEQYLQLLRTHYTKRVFDVPMRDGASLHTDVWVPKPNLNDDNKKWPIMFIRTPYSIAGYGTDGTPDTSTLRTRARFAPSSQMATDGYIFVHQDVRGRMMSQGEFVDIRPMVQDRTRVQRRDKTAIDESTDAWDTIDFLVKNIPENNGRVGMWGISYPGFYAAQGAVDAHPALKAVSPQAPVTEWFLGDDFHHNGAMCLADAFGFYQGFGRARPKPTKKASWDFDYDDADAYDFYLHLGANKNADLKYFKKTIAAWTDMMAHPNRDAWWQARDPRPHYRNIKPATMVVGGLYDAEDLWGAVHTYQSMNQQSPAGRVSLVLGPWSHGGWHRSDGDTLGPWSFGAKTSVAFRQLEAAFFASHLKGDGKFQIAEALVFDDGVNEWRRYASWPPPAQGTRLYAAGDGRLSLQAPVSAAGAAAGAAFDAFVSDPRAPVPTHAHLHDEVDHNYMVADMRFAARRPDVLVYDAAELAEDVSVVGPIEVDMWLSTDRTDADIVVQLIDVMPQDFPPAKDGTMLAGAHRLVRGEIFRMRFRDGFDKPQPMVPGQPTRVTFELPDVAHTFRRGHRLMIHVQSSWFPLFDRNPQAYVPNINEADDKDFVAATHKIHRDAQHPSSIRLPITQGRLTPIPTTPSSRP
jgi:uncharacterized protein